MLGAGNLDPWSDVAGWSSWKNGKADSGKRDKKGYGKGVDGERVRGYTEVPQVQVEQDELLPAADTECG